MILAIDQGTTVTSCVLFDDEARPVAVAREELGQSFPRPGWVEHDPGEIWGLVSKLASKVIADAGIGIGQLAAVGITNQRETVCVWDRASGEPLHSAIVWQDRRTAGRCEELREAGCGELVKARTGLVLDPYFSASKMQWLLENVEGLRERARRGDALLGTVDCWLAYKLTSEHLTDVTNASRTMLYNIAQGRWDRDLLELFDIPERALPEVRPSAGPFGIVDFARLGSSTGRRSGSGHSASAHSIPGRSVPLLGILGDQQAALFGNGCTEPGMAKNTYGTGSFILMSCGEEMPASTPTVVETIGWGVGRSLSYALEAPIFVAGAAIQWLRDGLQIIAQAGDSEAMASSLPDNGGVYFVPALTGLGAPHWNANARGLITGLTRGTGREQIVRAALEAIAYQTLDAVEAMEQSAGRALTEMRVDGGATANRWLMQFQANILGVPVAVSEVADTTARGAAMIAGVGAGMWTVEEVREMWRYRARYLPEGSPEEFREAVAGWREAVLMTSRG